MPPKKFVWEWNDYGWTRYDPQVSEALEDVYARNPRGAVDVRINYTAYTIDMGTMKQRNRRTNVVQEIRRVEDLSERERIERLEAESREKFVASNLKGLEKVFKSLEDPEEDDEITDDGVEKMCSELGVDPEDPVVLVISWHMRAENMCVYTKDEFMRGMGQMECKDLKALKKKLPELSAQMHDMEVFDAVYSWVYDFCKESSKKSLDLDYAKGMWKVMLEGRWDLIGDWLQFLEDSKYDNPIKRDEWSMLRLFMDTVREIQPLMDGTALQDDDVPWPVLIDEFVDYIQEKHKK